MRKIEVSVRVDGKEWEIVSTWWAGEARGDYELHIVAQSKEDTSSLSPEKPRPAPKEVH